MADSIRWGLLPLVLLMVTAVVSWAQPDGGEVPAVLIPDQPPSPQERDRRAARVHFAKALLCQREDRLLEALRHFEEARKLDPEAPAVHRAVIPLYLALGRMEEALAACRKTLDLDPDDFDAWYMYGRHLKDLGRPREALQALQRGVACPGIKEQLDCLVQMHFERGILHEDLQEYAQAEQAYREVLKIMVDKREGLLDLGPFNPEQLDQETAKTYERLGQVCLKAGRHDQAVTAFLQAQKYDPERAGRLSFHLAEVRLAQRRPAEALRHLDAYLRTQPQGAQAYELKVNILTQLGRERDILPALEEAALRDAYNMELQLLLARQYVRARAWIKAKQQYEALAAVSPAPEVYRGMFHMYREQGTLREVLDLLDRTLQDAREDNEAPNPANFARTAAAAARARAMLTVLREDADLVKELLQQVQREFPGMPRSRDTQRFLGVLAARTGQLPLAEQLFRACLAHLTPQTEAEVYSGLIDVLAEQRKHADVITLCRDGLKRLQNTDHTFLYVRMAQALMHLAKTDEALTAIDEACKLANDYNRLHVHRYKAELLRQAERYEQAIAVCQALLKEFPLPSQVRDIRYSLSNIYVSAHDYAKGEEQLRLILEADPNDATANNDLGYILADQGKNLEEAEKLIRRAIELDLAEKRHGKGIGTDGGEANAAYIDSLGWVLFRLGRLEEAHAQLEKATRLAGGEDDPVVWDHLGDVCFRLQRPQDARRAWEKAVQLYEQEKRRKMDERYHEIKHKLRTLK